MTIPAIAPPLSPSPDGATGAAMKFDAGEGVPGCNGATAIVVVVTLVAVVVTAVVVLFATVVVVLFGMVVVVLFGAVVVVVLADEEIVDGGGVVVVVVVGAGVVVVVVGASVVVVGVGVVVVVVVVVDVEVVDVVGVVVVVLTATVSSCPEVNPEVKSSSESATTRSARDGEKKRKDMLNFEYGIEQTRMDRLSQ
jgi:hypothetical protein